MIITCSSPFHEVTNARFLLNNELYGVWKCRASLRRKTGSNTKQSREVDDGQREMFRKAWGVQKKWTHIEGG